MPDIKTRKVIKGTIKTFDKVVNVGERIKNTTIKVKDGYKNDDENITDMANNKISSITQSSIYKFNKYGKKGFKETKDNIYKTKQKIDTFKKKQAERKIKKKTKNTIKNTSKRVIKTKQITTKSVKYTAKIPIKATKQTIKTTQKTAQMMKQTAKTTVKATKVAIKVTISSIKAIIMGTKALIAAIVAGGWVAIIIIIIICLIGLLCSSAFGIFFSSENTSNSSIVLEEYKTMSLVISELNMEFMIKLNEIQKNNKHDDYDIVSNRADWKEILAIYAVKVNISEKSTEVVTLSDDKINIIKSIFWEMNTITHATETVKKNVTVTDDKGNSTTKEETQTILHITISSKKAEEMAQTYNFNLEQRNLLAELLSEQYKSMWSAVIYGTSVGNSNIVEVARTQLGNVGGQPYWSWYGFSGRVEWCACFVSWCANECGYIESGIVPKFAGCQSQGVSWFKACGLWKDRGYIPKAGDIIFFDWENDNSSDHVGIVEYVENGTVHTIEGNSSNECKQREYGINSSDILGYGIPMY